MWLIFKVGNNYYYVGSDWILAESSLFDQSLKNNYNNILQKSGEVLSLSLMNSTHCLQYLFVTETEGEWECLGDCGDSSG